jgi:UDP-2,3-diacylglucosamine pyrophosphatase LpxH
VRTLVISDLHLGARVQNSVLVHREPLERLLAGLDDVDRLVLLGDVVELLEGRTAHAMAVAQPVLEAIGARLGSEREAILVPGNHDRRLVASWVRAQGSRLQPDAAVPLDATPALGRVTSWLSPARVRVHYPGVWLDDRVWAVHGHYLDRHLLPTSAFGIARGLLGRLPRVGASPVDYERAGGPSVTRVEAWLTRWLPRPLATGVEDLAELLRAATMPRVPKSFFHRRMAPLLAAVLGMQVRRAAIPALARVVYSLGVDADWVLFGHVHRLGPLAGDVEEQWRGLSGRPRIANTGSWTYEPLLLHRAAPDHPYWPGGAVLLEDGADPRAIALLGDLTPSDLH